MRADVSRSIHQNDKTTLTGWIPQVGGGPANGSSCVFSVKNVERGVEIREGNGGARDKDTRGGVKNSQRSCQEMDLV